jgi:hypothetical protein
VAHASPSKRSVATSLSHPVVEAEASAEARALRSEQVGGTTFNFR